MRFSFDRGGENALIVPDVGQDVYEEINLVVAGGNYGRRIIEGPHGFDLPLAETLGVDVFGDLQYPIHAYTHAEAGVSTIGGYLLAGTSLGPSGAGGETCASADPDPPPVQPYAGRIARFDDRPISRYAGWGGDGWAGGSSRAIPCAGRMRAAGPPGGPRVLVSAIPSSSGQGNPDVRPFRPAPQESAVRPRP